LAKKDKTEKPAREVTKRQLTQWQKQNKRHNIVFTAGIVIIAAVVLIVSAGWYLSEYRPFHQTAVKVYNAKFDTGYYIDRLKLAIQNKPSEYADYPNDDYLSAISDSIVKDIEQNELIIQQAASQFSITVADNETKARLKQGKLPVTPVYMDMERVQLVHDKLITDHFNSEVPLSAPQVHMMAMLLESESQANDIRARLQNSENFSALAQEYSLEAYSNNNSGDIGWHTQDIFAAIFGSKVPGDYAFGSAAGTLSHPRYDETISKPVGYWLVKVVQKIDEETAQVQAMLLGSQEEALKIKARLDAGEDFITLGKEFSQYANAKDNGGELGEVDKGRIGAIDTYVFNPSVQVGKVSDLIRDSSSTTTGGYWLIKVAEKADDRELELNERNYLLGQAFNQWVSSLWLDASSNIDDSYITPVIKSWAIQEATKG
jgi:parvulin-like peptidyl-prolyl isomerase